MNVKKKYPRTVCVYPLVFYYYCTCTVRVRVQCTAGDNLLDPQKSSPFENILYYVVQRTRVVNFYLRRYFRTIFNTNEGIYFYYHTFVLKDNCTCTAVHVQRALQYVYTCTRTVRVRVHELPEMTEKYFKVLLHN